MGHGQKKNNLKRSEGHQAGVKTAKKIVGYSIEKGIKHVTLYALSNEILAHSKWELKNL